MRKKIEKQDGSALLMTLIASVCITLLIALGYQIINYSTEVTRIELSLRGQAYNIAASGITETLSWFRSRRSQPVKNFNPKQQGPIANQGSEKDLQEGLVRSFPISETGMVWGQFRVLPETVEDITHLRGRGKEGDGLVWRVRSKGILYLNRDKALGVDDQPNEIVHQMTLMTEFQRMNIKLPAASALIVNRADQVEILQGGRIRGLEGAAITFGQNTGRPTIEEPTEVSSLRSRRLSQAPADLFSIDLKDVFGISWREFIEVGDIVVENSNLLPPILPRAGIYVVDGDAIFDRKRPLTGGGVLIVRGDIQIESNSNSSFTGVIYCFGNLTIDAPALITGAVMVRGNVRLQGFGDFAEIQYNGDQLNFLKQRLGQYRRTQALVHVR